MTSRYDTPVACPVCDGGTLGMDSLGGVYCLVHGDTDVPDLNELRANCDPGFTVEGHPGNAVLYVVPVAAPVAS